jgi:hypothetical protein
MHIQRLRWLLFTAAVSASLALPAQDGGSKEPVKGKGVDKVDFQKHVLPILEKNCFECHSTAHVDGSGKTKKPKGNVIFDNREGIQKSKKGKVVVPKKPADSLMIAAISLPADDEDRMPPAKKGDPLPKEQIELLMKWIEQGADFGDWTGKEKGKGKETEAKGGDKPGGKPAGGKPGDKPAGSKPEGSGDDEELAELADGVPPLDQATLAALTALHARVESLGDGSPLVRVTFLGHEDEVTDATIAALQTAKAQIAELSLARTAITDAAGAHLAKLRTLYRLDLRQTAIADEGVKALAGLANLRTLNLFGTKVGDAGVSTLADCENLRELYVWQTPVSAQAVVALQQALPAARIVFAADLPEPMTEAPATRGRPRR